MTKVLVIRWPEQELSLFERRFGRVTPVVEHAGPEAAETLIADADEIRVLHSRSYLRLIALEGVAGAELAEAAKYGVENTLPVPISTLCFSARVLSKKRGVSSVLVSAIPQSAHDEMVAWLGAHPSFASKAGRLMWAGTGAAAWGGVRDGAVCGRNWAAVIRNGEWLDVQTATASNEAKNILVKKFGDGAVWTELASSDEARHVAAAKDGSILATHRAPSRERMVHTPLLVALAALLIIFISYGMRYYSAKKRAAAAAANVESLMESVMPGTRVVSPLEQIRSERTTLRKRFNVVKERVEKRGSALDWLEALERSSFRDSFVIDDMKISNRSLSLIGSASGTEVIEELSSILRTEAKERSMEIGDPEIRRSNIGYGLDFVFKGTATTR